jgi:hypothetical protein
MGGGEAWGGDGSRRSNGAARCPDSGSFPAQGPEGRILSLEREGGNFEITDDEIEDHIGKMESEGKVMASPSLGGDDASGGRILGRELPYPIRCFGDPVKLVERHGAECITGPSRGNPK